MDNKWEIKQNQHYTIKNHIQEMGIEKLIMIIIKIMGIKINSMMMIIVTKNILNLKIDNKENIVMKTINPNLIQNTKNNQNNSRENNNKIEIIYNHSIRKFNSLKIAKGNKAKDKLIL